MQKMGLNPLELTSGHKFEPVQGLNSLLIGLVWPFKRSCLAFGLESYSNSILNLNKVWNLGVIFFILIGPVWPFKNDWISHMALNYKFDHWSQLWTCTRFESSSLRVSFSSRLVLSGQLNCQLFLLLSSFCSFLFDTWIYLIAFWWFYPEYFGFHRNSFSCNCVFMKIKDELF